MGNWDDIKSLLGLVAALGIIFYLTWLTTRFVAGKSRGRQAGRHMQVLDRLPISGDKSLLIVRIAGRCSVLALSGQQIRLLRHLTQEEAALYDKQHNPRPAQEGGLSGFWQTLRKQAGLSFGWGNQGGAQGITPAVVPADDTSHRAEPPTLHSGDRTAPRQELTQEQMLDLLNRRVDERKRAGRRRAGGER